MEWGCVTVMLQCLSVYWVNDYSKRSRNHVIPSHTEVFKRKLRKLALVFYMYCNGLIQTLWFLNLLIRHVLKCITLLPANPALPMVEVTVLLVVKKC